MAIVMQFLFPSDYFNVKKPYAGLCKTDFESVLFGGCDRSRGWDSTHRGDWGWTGFGFGRVDGGTVCAVVAMMRGDQPLVRAYIGNGLRSDLERFEM